MEDFELSQLEELETKPFKMVSLSTMLLLGALNHNPKVVFEEEDVQVALEKFIEKGSLSELLETLFNLLQDSSFFKSLQKTEEEVKK